MGDPFDELRRYLDGRFNALESRFADVPTRTEMNARFEEARTEMEAGFREVAATFGELRQYVDEHAAAARGRTEVLIEAVRSDIRLLAEGHGALAGGIEQLTAGQQRTQQRLDQLDVGQQRTQQRLDQLEAGQQTLLDVTHRIETRLAAGP